MGGDHPAGQQRSEVGRHLGERRSTGDVGGADSVDRGGADGPARVDHGAELVLHAAGVVEQDDADLHDAVDARVHPGRFQVDDGDAHAAAPLVAAPSGGQPGG